MPRIGIIGLGMMGRTHYEAYTRIAGAQVVAVADRDPKRAAGDLSNTWSNLGETTPYRLPMARIHGMTDYRELLNMPDVDVVDICVPTPEHAEVAIAALQAGKHVLCEKPLARTLNDAEKIAAAAAKAKGFFMPAMVMRFWPEWAWLKQVVTDGRYGRVRAATFRRLSSPPRGWFADGALSGGALLDLHIHDTDFVYYLFGLPQGIYSRGYSQMSGNIDHVVTQYMFDDVPLVVAEGGWLADGFGFSMRYTVNFERATADFDLGRAERLLVHQDGKATPIHCGDESGYAAELRYFLNCVERSERPAVVTVEDAVTGMTIIDRERMSIETGAAVHFPEPRDE